MTKIASKVDLGLEYDGFLESTIDPDGYMDAIGAQEKLYEFILATDVAAEQVARSAAAAIRSKRENQHGKSIDTAIKQPVLFVSEPLHINVGENVRVNFGDMRFEHARAWKDREATQLAKEAMKRGRRIEFVDACLPALEADRQMTLRELYDEEEDA